MIEPDINVYGVHELRRRIENSVLQQEPDVLDGFSVAGIAVEQQAQIQHLLPVEHSRAAVLMPLVVRDSGLHLLFTQRASHLRSHAGQISFPGGRIEATDESVLDAALRETQEEIGLEARYIEPVGYLPPLLVFTGFLVTPVVAFVQPGFTLNIDVREVAEVFEAPFQHFLDPANHLARERQLGELKIKVYDLPFGERRIWGATAGIIMSLYRLLTPT